MTTYCYRCNGCAQQITLPSPEGGTHIGSDGVECGGDLRRDWKAENATFTRVPGGART